MSLNIAKGLALPDEIVTQKNAIVAMSGAGKSNTAVVLAEEMYAAGIPWCAIDPKGDWHGIRSSADGKHDGLPVPIFGGLHGDIPLEPTGGKFIGNLIAERRLTCVLDVSEFDTRQQQFRFLADLAETLLKRNREPLHLFLEEADDYLPQMARDKGELPRCLGAWLRLVKRGRFRGMGSTLITQRSSAIHKDVLNQADTLIAMRVTAPLDKKAIRAWVDEYGLSRELVESLSSLEDGEAWIWSPQKLKMTERVRFRRRRTYDSGETPTLGKAREPATLADVDLDQVKAEMAETIERAQADDPKILRARIADLERERRQRPEPEARVETVEVPVVSPEAVLALAQAHEGFVSFLEALDGLAGQVRPTAQQLGDALRAVSAAAEIAAHPLREVPAPARAAAEPRTAPRPEPARVPRDAAAVAPTDALGDGAPAVLLRVLAQHPEGRTRKQLAMQGGYQHRGSTMRGAFAALKKPGYIVVSGEHVTITEAGLAAIGPIEPLPTGPALLDHWRSKLGDRDNAARRAFDALIAQYPDDLTHEELGEATGDVPRGSTQRGALGSLRNLGLVDRGRVRLADELMDAAR